MPFSFCIAADLASIWCVRWDLLTDKLGTAVIRGAGSAIQYRLCYKLCFSFKTPMTCQMDVESYSFNFVSTMLSKYAFTAAFTKFVSLFESNFDLMVL